MLVARRRAVFEDLGRIHVVIETETVLTPEYAATDAGLRRALRVETWKDAENHHVP